MTEHKCNCPKTIHHDHPAPPALKGAQRIVISEEGRPDVIHEWEQEQGR